MKAKIEAINYLNSENTRFGPRHKFEAVYDGRTATFMSKDKEQTDFKLGVENEFNETSVLSGEVTYYQIKKKGAPGNSNFSKQLVREQSKYSGFAMSYAKDLVVSGAIKHNLIFQEAKKMMDWMVEQDKKIGNG